MAQSARGIFTLGTARLMAIRKQLRLSHEWDTYQEHVLALLSRKEKEGAPFFQMYGIGSSTRESTLGALQSPTPTGPAWPQATSGGSRRRHYHLLPGRGNSQRMTFALNCLQRPLPLLCGGGPSTKLTSCCKRVTGNLCLGSNPSQ